MSQENVERIRIGFEAFNRGDMDTLLAGVHPEVIWEENTPAFTGLDRVYRGHEGFKQWVADVLEAWEDLRSENNEFIDAGDHVIVVAHFQGRGRASGVQVEGDFHNVLEIRDGMIVHRRLFTDREDALEAAGLPA
ncbi:MAG: nuclear transport factor 2 family protein [Actinomycetota bacterium]|nr:nuclear transport factor 2 family protein [Actinomycetota bacterium]